MIKRITTHSKCFNRIWNEIKSDSCKIRHVLEKTTHNLTLPAPRNFHTSAVSRKKIYVDAENAYAYAILPQLRAVQPLPSNRNPVRSVEEFEKFLDQNWRSSRAAAIVEAFERVKEVCVEHGIALSDRRFDKLVDGLMDHCEKLTDEELYKLLCLLSELPPCETMHSHNFHDVWSCLDDVCCWKMGDWSLETMHTFAAAWYRLHLGRVSDYVFEVIDRTGKKAKRLDKKMLLHTYFHVNVCRRKAIEFDIEHALAEKVGLLTVDELAVVAMGYFKTRSKVKLKPILYEMMRKVSENCETIHEIALMAILKAIRLTQNLDAVDDLREMLDKLVGQIPRFSPPTLVHLALVGTGLQLKHEATLTGATERLTGQIESIRLKDIERILLANSMFDLDSSVYRAAYEEIHKESRRPEIAQYNRCVPCALNYLSQRKIYSYTLTDEILNGEFIDEAYGKTGKQVPRELFSLDACIEIECPDYKGRRLSPAKKYKAAKWLTEFTPSENQWKKLSLADKFYLDVARHVASVVGGERYVKSDHVLPHFSKSDVIVCKEKETGRFVEPFGFENYVLGDVKRPFGVDTHDWYSFVILTPNQTIRDQVLPLGSFVMKERQLKALGYTPIFIFWNEWSTLTTDEKSSMISGRLT